ncbi:MAG: sigma-70 family RNA polymerase sigma factor [Haliscomenobacter sp.]|uniref:RNA polymerase sigma factor n=1 Tax=Haliscomenobacter sp. TaxID=2717303 RepID=UPI0029A2B756|nr:sigma-70 family RNA polymerase sigma factor [Haliscomenobacter sp.]MDX2070742.1 sigma-70 family RNA polymerase sigma factor [Haliscomenobacter sp.]
MQTHYMEEDLLLVQRVLRGDQAAFRQLVEQYQNYVFTIAMRVLNSREEAEEVSQDVFLKVYKMLGSYRQESKFSSWLYAVTYRTAIDNARKKKLPLQNIDPGSTALQTPDVHSKNPAELTQDNDLRHQVQSVINRLKPGDANIITLYYLHEQSVQEIAEITGLSVTNVKTKLFRLREQLRQELTASALDQH